MPYKSKEERLAYLKRNREQRKLLGLPTGGRNNVEEALRKYREKNREALRDRARERQRLIYLDPIKKTAYRARQNAWRAANADKCRAMGRVKRQALKKLVLGMLGGACSGCGEKELEFLTIDHIDNDGAAHRESIGHGGMKMYRAVQHAPDLSRYQCLCFNCNMKKSFTRGSSPAARSMAKLRISVLSAYGGACDCCKETDADKLALDHVQGLVGQRKRARALSYRDARDRKYPSDYQVLCHNCNSSKSFGGVCIHKR